MRLTFCSRVQVLSRGKIRMNHETKSISSTICIFYHLYKHIFFDILQIKGTGQFFNHVTKSFFSKISITNFLSTSYYKLKGLF